MQEFYDLASGIGFKISLAVCLAGIFWRLFIFARLVKAVEPRLFAGFKWSWALQSLARWVLPLAKSQRQNPIVCLAGYVFHLCFILLALFASGHAVLWSLGLDLAWPFLPDSLSAWLSPAALACLLFFALRRLLSPEIKALSGAPDWLMLGLTALPVDSGYLAARQWFAYDFLLCLHVASGDILLLALPFSKLSHMFFFPISRMLTGSDFGKREVGAW